MMKLFLHTLVAVMFASVAVAQQYPSPTFKNITVQENLNLPSKPANSFFAAPDGVAGMPAFRVMVPSDVPFLNASKITAGTFDTARIPSLPISQTTGLQAALDAKAPLASPALTGTPTAPTPGLLDNSTKIATTEWVLTNVATPSFPSQSANTVLAAPNGSAGSPTFRLLAMPDLPSTVVSTNTTQSISGAKTFTAAPVVDLASTATETPVATFSSGAAVSGTSYSTIGIGKGAGYGGQVSGYITQGGDSGLVLRTLNGGTPTELMRLSSNGNVTAPTSIADDNSTNIATTAWVKRERALLPSMAALQASIVPGSIKRVTLQHRTSQIPNSGGDYERISFANLTGYPSSSYIRSNDRLMPDGVTVDATNGGYWILSDATPDPMQFGAICDFTTNDRQAIVDAGVYANLRSGAAGGGGGGVVEFSCGTGHFWNSNITLPNGLSWHSRVQTPMKYNGAGAAVTMYGNNGTIDGFSFSYSGTFGTNIVGVQIGVAELAQRQVVRNNTFNNFGTSIYHKTAVGATIEGNIINNSALYGVLFENTTNADAGDAAVFNNIISNSGLAAGTGTAAFRYHSGGGLRFQFNKLLSFQRGFDMQIPNGAATVDLMFTGNSIENQSIAGIRLGRNGTTGSFGSLTLSGNEVAGTVQCLSLNVGAFNGVVIGNAFNLCSQAAIVINADVTNWQIEHNNYAASGANIIDTRADSNSEHLTDVLRSPVNVSSSATYSYYASIAVPAYRSVKARIFVEGILQGAGFVARNYDVLLSNNGTTLVLTQISNTTGTGSVALDLDVDLTTTAGTARIGFRRNAAAGGSGTFNGSYSVNLEGRIGTLIRLQ